MSYEAEELDRIAMLETSPAEAVNYLRQLFAAEGGGPAKVYDTWSAVAWKVLTRRLYGADAEGWYDAARQVSSLLHDRQFELSERIKGQADLLLESCRFGRINSADMMSSREPVRQLISIIDEITRDGAEAKRAEVLRRSKLKQSNLSRLLSNMEDAGLILRNVVGKEVAIRLTEAGKKSLRPGVGDDGWTGRYLEGTPGVEMRPKRVV
jgi:DNA-binding transcriptional ArsR family regulator